MRPAGSPDLAVAEMVPPLGVVEQAVGVLPRDQSPHCFCRNLRFGIVAQAPELRVREAAVVDGPAANRGIGLEGESIERLQPDARVITNPPAYLGVRPVRQLIEQPRPNLSLIATHFASSGARSSTSCQSPG